ncbi:MAG: HD domain-containing protein [Dehalococcoidia bacterium]|nr:HD domain-containing protein [Dehalococcoidia bacterium]
MQKPRASVNQWPLKVRMGLRESIGLLVVFIVVVLGVAYFFMAKRAADEDVQQALEYRLHVATSFAQHLDEVFEQALDHFADLADAHGAELAQATIPTISGRPVVMKGTRADIALLIGRNGRVLQADEEHPEFVGLDLSSSDYVKRVFEEGQPAAFPAVDPTGKEVAAVAIAPIKFNGETVSLLVGYVKLSNSHIVNDLNSLSPGKTGYVDLIDNSATVLFSTKGNHVGRQVDNAIASKLDSGPNPATIDISSDQFNPDYKAVVAMASLSTMPWHLVIGQDEEEAFSQSRILQNSLIVFGIGALLFVIVLGWFTTNRITQPIRVLTVAARRLGDGDFSTPINLTGGLEVSTLAATMERMRANITELLETSQRGYRSSIRLLATVIDARDAYTASHSTDVSSIAGKIARAMGLGSNDIDNIEVAGLVHDIGKIGVDDAVLNKPGLLSPIEQAAMMTHAEIGAAILREMEDFRALVPLAKHHHERYDGRGYPDGLAGEAIPLGARILAVADAFSAMTSNRPYRRALSVEEAASRLGAGKGSQFDPLVTDVLLALLEEGHPLEFAGSPAAALTRAGSSPRYARLMDSITN